MVSEKCLRQYAELAVRLGVNVQKGQLLVIKAQVDSAPFVRMCVEEGYRAGAGEVIDVYKRQVRLNMIKWSGFSAS